MFLEEIMILGTVPTLTPPPQKKKKKKKKEEQYVSLFLQKFVYSN